MGVMLAPKVSPSSTLPVRPRAPIVRPRLAICEEGGAHAVCRGVGA